MKTLVLYDSASRNASAVAIQAARSLDARRAKMTAIGGDVWWNAVRTGAAFLFRKSQALLPLEEDIAGYGRLVLVGPAGMGALSPAIMGFVHDYQIAEKEVCGLLVCAGRPVKPAHCLNRALQDAGARCRNILALHPKPDLLHGLKCGALRFYFEDDGRLGIQASEPGREARDALERDVLDVAL